MPAAVAGCVRIIFIHRTVYLGCKYNAMSFAVILQSLSNNLLTLTIIINIGCISKINAGINGGIDYFYGFFFFSGAAKIHAAQTQFTHLYAGSSKISIFHFSFTYAISIF